MDDQSSASAEAGASAYSYRARASTVRSEARARLAELRARRRLKMARRLAESAVARRSRSARSAGGAAEEVAEVPAASTDAMEPFSASTDAQETARLAAAARGGPSATEPAAPAAAGFASAGHAGEPDPFGERPTGHEAGVPQDVPEECAAVAPGATRFGEEAPDSSDVIEQRACAADLAAAASRAEADQEEEAPPTLGPSEAFGVAGGSAGEGDPPADCGAGDEDVGGAERGATDASSLQRLPGAGPALVWMLGQVGVQDLEALAAADAEDLGERLGLVGRLLDLPAWIAEARRLSCGDRGP